jgi:hypothetical protein
MFAIVVAACYYDYLLLSSFLALSETTLLWKDGLFAGWFQVVFFLLVFDGMMLFPLWLMWDSYKDIKK